MAYYRNRLFDKLSESKTEKEKIIKSFIYFVLPIFVLFIPFIITRFPLWSQFTFFEFFALFCAGLMSTLMPYLLNRYKDKFDAFFDALILHDQDQNTQFKLNNRSIAKYELHHKNLNLIFFFIMVVLVIGALISNASLLSHYGFYSNDIYIYILFVYLAFLLFQTAMGIAGVIMTIIVITDLAKENSIIEDAMDECYDRGMYMFGDFSFKTTLYFLFGLLYIPIVSVYIMNAEQLIVEVLLILSVVMYGSFLILSFLVPNLILNAKAQAHKRFLIAQNKQKYKQYCIDILESYPNSNAPKDIELEQLKALEVELRTLNLYNYINTLNNINTYPITLKWLVTIVAPSIATIVFVLINFFPKLVDFIRLFM